MSSNLLNKITAGLASAILLLVSALPSTGAETVIYKTNSAAITRTLSSWDKFFRAGNTNQVHAFWFKRADTNTVSTFYSDAISTIGINSNGFLTYGTNVLTSAYAGFGDWRHFALVYTIISNDVYTTGSCYKTVTPRVNVEVRLNNTAVYSATNVALNYYNYIDETVVCDGSTVLPTGTTRNVTMLNGFTGYFDDYVVIRDVTEWDIERLYKVGARYFDSNDARLGVYWVDTTSFPAHSTYTTTTADKPVLGYLVTINSDYGTEKISPSPSGDGKAIAVANATTQFTAPYYIYLDRHGNELTGTAEEIRNSAYYRLVNDGYSAAGISFQGTPTTAFTLSVTADMTVSWFWRKQYAVIINSSAAGVQGISDEDLAGLGNPTDSIGKHWVEEDTLFSTAIDGMLNPFSYGVRFVATGFIVENDPGSSDRYMVFSGTNDFLSFKDALPLTNMSNFTIEFWAKRDQRTTTQDEDVFTIGEGSGSPKLLRVGFRSSADGNQMFLSDTNGSVIASVDSGYTDNQWHHWAWVYDSTNTLLTLYRDGSSIGTFTTALSFQNNVQNGVNYQYYKGQTVYPSTAYENVIRTSSTSSNTVYEAESANVLSGTATVDYSGDNGTTVEFGTSGSPSIKWTNINVGTVSRLLTVHWGVAGQQSRTLTVKVNSATVGQFTQSGTSGGFIVSTMEVTFTNGANTIEISGLSTTGTQTTKIYVDQMVLWSEQKLDSLSLAFSRWTNVTSGTLTDFSFSPTNQADRFGFKYTSQILIDTAGTYTFRTASDDGSALYLDGTLVVNNDGIHGSSTKSASVTLVSGLHDIEVDYFEWDGGESLTVSYSGPDTGNSFVAIPTSRLYRDADSATIGASLSTNNCFAGGLNNVRFWSSVRSETEVKESMAKQEYGSGVSGLVLELTFDTPDASSVTSSQGFIGTLVKFTDLFPSTATSDAMAAAIFPAFSWTERTNTLGLFSRVRSDSFSIKDWVQLTWVWQRQYRLRVVTADVDYEGLPYIKTEAGNYEGAETQEAWVPELTTVTVGAQYRTDGRCQTLSGLVGQGGILQWMTMGTVVDGTFNGKATREYTINVLTNWGDITVQYDRTVFRAEIPIGKGLDVSSTAALNVNLIPDLCEGGTLLLTGNALTDVSANPVFPDNGTVAQSGRKVLFDKVGKQLLPLMPGTYRVEWKDANDPNTSYLIEVVSHLPQESLSLYYDREDENGYRYVTDGAYVRQLTFGDVTDEFPGSPSAHYRHFYSKGGNTAPVMLDANSVDRWHFDEVTYSTAMVTVDGQSKSLSASSAGRSVLLFSYTPSATSVARGDASQEAYVARIVEALDPDTRTQSASTFSSSNFYALELKDNSTLRHSVGGSLFDPNVSARTHDFWYQASLAPETPTNDQVVYFESGTDQNLTAAFKTYFGVRSTTNAVNPGGFYFAVTKRVMGGDATYSDLLVKDFTEIPQDYAWHHWAIIRNSSRIQIYRDGVLVSEQDCSAVSEYSGGTINVGGGISAISSGRLDMYRVWTTALSAPQVRSSMLTSAPTFLTNNLSLNITFDGGLQQYTNVFWGITNISYLFTNSAPAGSGYLYSSASDIANQLVFPEQDGSPEVATRILTKLDTAGLSSGYIIPEVSNYNPDIYNRNANTGAWGPIYPVNWSGLFSGDNALKIAWYENPYSAMPASSTVLHPNVHWPYVVASYDDVKFPTLGEHKNKRIYIASRLGTEGVDATGVDQLVFDPASYSDVTVYNQPAPSSAGYNPNEEHALVAPSIKDQLTGDTAFNLGQDAAFALQCGLNVTNQSSPSTYTSEPWVLVQFYDKAASEWKMAAYKVETTRSGSESFPALDSETHLPVDALGQPVQQPTDPTYDFSYITFAGDALVPPYPLNLVIGNVIVAKNWGGQLSSQRTLWRDKNQNYWTVSGDGSFFFRYWYPLPDEFWYDTNRDGVNDVTSGTSFAWLPSDGIYAGNTSANAQVVRYATFWRNDYPVLKRGETLTYTGGEYKAENSTAEGLPGIVGFASAQIVYDSARPEMVFDSSTIDSYSARIIRPLEPLEYAISQSDMPTKLTPAYTDNVMVVGARWYFKALTGSLQKRFYYDSLTSKLVFRGRLNDLESDAPQLTTQPVSSYVLEPNVMTAAEYRTLTSLPINSEMITAIDWIFHQSQDPNGISDFKINPYKQYFYSGVESSSGVSSGQPGFYTYSAESGTLSSSGSSSSDVYQHLNSLGAGAALIPNASFLTESSSSPAYITIVENNHPDVGGAISLHIIRIGDERYRGTIKLVEAKNVFDEKVNLKHTGDFGGRTDNVYYQWWVRDVASLQSVGLPGTDSGWQIFQQGLGLNTIEFNGRPDVMLSDKLFFVRYGESNELNNVDGVVNVVTDDTSTATVDDRSWRAVDFNNDTWSRAASAAVPYQWAGAANSPQLQADGSKKYVPQLVMGWVKRVLDRVNPYEARYTDFYSSTSPATYSSMLQIAGAPFGGSVALNSDKNVIEHVGLIELYETVLKRAKDLTLNVPGASTSGTDQALLLAATRLAFLYELLAREAYSDAQNPLIRVTEENGLGQFAPYVHAFYNQQATLLDEELGLLRGTDFLKAYPVYNRLFWNYVKGEGEAAYNANYNIYDVNKDGVIDESDAAQLYPQGHGDAWGHFLSANSMHYELLRHNAFTWNARAELYSLLDNVIKADYLDEKSFARIAAAKARTGLEILKTTYSKAYTEDPGGQWQGYTDTDAARAWGVSEWAKRTGQAALFDWVVGNAIVPPASTNGVLDDLDRIDRVANSTELSEIASTALSIQLALDEANGGSNPIGLDRDAVVFDIDPLQYDGAGGTRVTQFEQAYNKAVVAAQNALVALEQASRADYQLQKIADDTLSLQTEALRQDVDYRNRLIEIFGTPYAGTIGTGKVFAEGYDGPDTLLYLYVDRTDTSDLIPDPDTRYSTLTNSTFKQAANHYKSLDWDPNYADITDTVADIYSRFYLTQDFTKLILGENSLSAQRLTIAAPVRLTKDYAFQAEAGWESRTAYGRVQTIIGEMLNEQVAMDKSVRDYAAYVEQLQILNNRLTLELRATEKKELVRSRSATALAAVETVRGIAALIEAFSQWGWDFAWQSAQMTQEYFPKVLGFSNDATAPARGAAYTTGLTFRSPLMLKWTLAMMVKEAAAASSALISAQAESDEVLINEFREMNAIVSEVGMFLTQEESKRLDIAQHVQSLELLAQTLQSTKAEGFRLLQERESFNITLASKAQRNRYRDMVLRLSRNEALTQYQDAFENAQRYAWLAAKAYDYETSLSSGDPAAATTVLQEIVKCRSLGLWQNGQPRIGQGGLAHHLARLKANFDVLKGQLGINNPQIETGRLSLRHEHFRIATNAFSSDQRWEQALQAARVDNLWDVPAFVQYCRPFAAPSDGAQPGLVIEFSTEINSGKNVFGRPLGGADHSYSSANFATKIRSLGVWFENYNATGLSMAPRVYLVPVGADVLRIANSQYPETRMWNVVEQQIPVPFVINTADLRSPDFIPSLHSLNGSFVDIRRFGDFRAYHTGGEVSIDTAQLMSNSRLIGRSVWNTRWLLIIPGATLHADANYGLDQFVKGVSDIRLLFQTYSHEGN